MTYDELFKKPIEQTYNNQVIKFMDIDDLIKRDETTGFYILEILQKAIMEQLLQDDEEGYIQRIDRINDQTDIKTTVKILKDKISFNVMKETYYTDDDQDETERVSPGMLN